MTTSTITLKGTAGSSFSWPYSTTTPSKYAWTVLYFYPKDATPGCTIEGHDFTKLQKDFEQHGARILGVSRDSLASHEKFKAKECYTIELIADTESLLCQAFDVLKMKKNYGREYLGIERSTFLIDNKGVIRQQWRAVKVEGHAQAVLAALIDIKTT